VDLAFVDLLFLRAVLAFFPLGGGFTATRRLNAAQHHTRIHERRSSGRAGGQAHRRFSAKASLARWAVATLRFRPPHRSTQRLNAALDRIHDKFGSAALTTADLHETPTRKRE
jgi:hypothetical protein